jgi:peptidoglycan glycosyltransferase
MNKRIQRFGVFIMLCYLALFVKLNQVQIFQADDLNNNPLNSRVVQREFNRPRGAITSGDNVVLAQSVDVDDATIKRYRTYPEKDLFGQITGYFSFTYGAAGVEKQYSEELSGNTTIQQIRGVADIFSNQQTVGNVQVTVRKDLQQVARDALKDPRTGADREGSVVLTDPRTGEILAFWSYPSYDPNLLSGTDDKATRAAFALLNKAPGKPMQAKQYQERYFPGSTFKVVTSGVGLQTGKVTVDNPNFPPASQYQPPVGQPIKNFAGEVCGGTLFVILQQSCNSAYAEMGQKVIGAKDMLDGAQNFGFNAPTPIDLPAPGTSTFPAEMTKDPAKLAQASIGQNDVQATPLEMALVAGAPANKGRIMKPHVLRQVTDSDGRVVKTADPEVWQTPMDEANADTLRQAMLGVVTGGTGTPAQIPGYEVGGKTGTAQVGDGTVHTWFMGFAGLPGAEPTVAVAVVVLNQKAANNDNTGGVIAGPIAKAVMQKALQIQAAGGTTPAPSAAPTTTPVTTLPTGNPGNGVPQGNTGANFNTTVAPPTTRRPAAVTTPSTAPVTVAPVAPPTTAPPTTAAVVTVAPPTTAGASPPTTKP